MKTIRIDGIDYEVGTDAANQALSKWQAKVDEALANAQAEIERKDAEMEKLQAKFDESVAALAKKDAEIAELPKKIAAQAKVRAELEQKARKVLGPKAKLDSDDLKLRKQVIEKLSPNVKLDEKSAGYIEARFDAAFEAFESREDDDETDGDEDPVDKARADVDNVDEDADDESEKRIDSDEAYERMRKDSASAWQRTLKKHQIEIP